MATSDWQRVKLLLADALEEPPEKRTAFIQRSCNGDTTLMREVEALLAQETGVLEQFAANRTANKADGDDAGRRVGAYVIVREIGRGGMGAVYLAERADGEFEKRVAIKLLKRGTDTDEVLRRFRAERSFLARLDHSNIARLLDGGTTDDGLPYFVMEHIEGEPITEFVRRKELSIPDRLALFLKVCGAVEAAHAAHVIHRDLKASNILVRTDGEPKLLDFGIAKLVDLPDDAALVTMTQERRLTPVCASPEQARGERVTGASDVYALGALLYELLADVSPHRFSSGHPTAEEVARVICEDQPAPPSGVVAHTEVRRRLRGDLDTIALTALDKEPARRYASVSALAEDVRRYLGSKPIFARKTSHTYRFARFVRRNGARLAAAALLLAAGVSVALLVATLRNQSSTKPATQRVLPADNPEEATRDAEARQLFLQARTLVYEFGTGAKYQESLTNAVQLLENATARDPKFALGFSLLAEAHLYLYRAFEHTEAHLRAAKEATDTALRLAPESGAAHFAQAVYCYDGERDLPRAEKEITASLRVLPTRVDALEVATKVETRLGKWTEAVEHGEKAVELDPRDPALIPALAQCYTALRRYAEVERVIDRALGVVPPQFAGPLWRRKASIVLAQGDTQKARAALQSSPADTPLEAYVRLQIAVFERNFNEAAEIADKIKVPALEPWLLCWRGLIAHASGNEAGARNAFAAACVKLTAELRNQPNDPNLLAYLAFAEAGSGENEKAVQQARRAVELWPITKDALDGATVATIEAQVYAWVGKADEALDKLATLTTVPNALTYGALALDPGWDAVRGDPRFAELLEQSRRPIDRASTRSEIASNPPTSDLVAYDLFLRGQALMNDIATSTDWEGDNRRAVDLFERAVTHDPKFALGYAQLCRAAVNLYMWVDHSEARLAQAKKAAEEAARLAANSPDTYVAEGQLADAVGDDRRAFERFSLAHRARPNDEVILSRLAQAEETLGMWDEALRDMEKAKQLAPRNSNIPNYLKGMYAGRRDYGTSDRVCDEAIAQFPNGPIYYRSQKVANSLDRGDTQQARVRFADIPEKFNASGFRSLRSLEISFAERDYDRFNREFANLPWDRFIEDFKLEAELMRVLVAEQQGDRATIESILAPRRENLVRDIHDSSHTTLGPNARRSAILARIDSYLGRTEEALRESEDAVAKTPEPVGKPTQEIIRAEVLMRAGQTGAALDILEGTARVPYGPSYGDLLSLRWDRMRADQRFKAIVAQLRNHL